MKRLMPPSATLQVATFMGTLVENISDLYMNTATFLVDRANPNISFSAKAAKVCV